MPLRTDDRSRHPTIGVCLALLVLVGCGGPLGTELFVHGAPRTPADAVVVLGNRPPRTAGGDVAPETARRMRRAAEVFGTGIAPLFIITGSADEAPVMRARAIELGVPDAVIRVDATSADTADNARNAVALVCEGRVRCEPRLIVVSSPYHLRRARQLFRCAGARVQVAATEVPADTAVQLFSTVYEYGVRIGTIFYDACRRARSLTAR